MRIAHVAFPNQAIHSKHGPEVMAVAAKFLYLAPFLVKGKSFSLRENKRNKKRKAYPLLRNTTLD